MSFCHSMFSLLSSRRSSKETDLLSIDTSRVQPKASNRRSFSEATFDFLNRSQAKFQSSSFPTLRAVQYTTLFKSGETLQKKIKIGKINRIFEKKIIPFLMTCRSFKNCFRLLKLKWKYFRFFIKILAQLE